MSGTLELIAERQIGSSSVIFTGAEHEGFDPNTSDKTLREYVKAVDKVIVEYLPDELEQTAYKAPILGTVARAEATRAGITEFFNWISKVTAEEGKSIQVLDPAYTQAHNAYYSILPNVLFGAGALGMAYAERIRSKKKLSRRAFMPLFALATAAIAVGVDSGSWLLQYPSVTKNYPSLYREDSLNARDARWVTVPQALVQEGSRNPSERKLVIYPREHIEVGFLHYLDNPEQRRRKFDIYSQLPGLIGNIRNFGFNPMFQYWEKTSEVPITR